MKKIVSINISKGKGVAKKPVEAGVLEEGCGLVGDAHSGPGDRQVSLLALESIHKQNMKLKTRKIVELKPGDFAENITTDGIDLVNLKIGTRLMINNRVELEITKIGKECHRYCSIYYKTGDCIMPREGVFARVLKGGSIKIEDKIKVVKSK
jgi:MOSC domain-containing protein YiiM